jgi:putative transposase
VPAARSVRERSYAHEKPPLSKRALEDLALTRQIHEIHRRSHGCYGAPRIHAELLQEHGVRLGRKRMARLMRAAGLRGVSRRRFVRTTTPSRTPSRSRSHDTAFEITVRSGRALN